MSDATQRSPVASAGRILLAEDDAVLREFLSQVLRNEGFEVVAAEDGVQALALSRAQGPYDLMLLDEEMPLLTGREFLAQLRAEGATVAALLFSGSLEIDEDEQERLGARLLRKPASLAALIQAVRQAIGSNGMTPL